MTFPFLHEIFGKVEAVYFKVKWIFFSMWPSIWTPGTGHIRNISDILARDKILSTDWSALIQSKAWTPHPSWREILKAAAPQQTVGRLLPAAPLLSHRTGVTCLLCASALRQE
jgi:hypothetical protein